MKKSLFAAMAVLALATVIGVAIPSRAMAEDPTDYYVTGSADADSDQRQYQDLAGAIEAIDNAAEAAATETDYTITVTGNSEESTPAVLSSQYANVTLNLNGHTLSYTQPEGENPDNVYFNVEYATLTIVDEPTTGAGSGTGTIEATTSGGAVLYIAEEGTVTMTSGTLRQTQAYSEIVQIGENSDDIDDGVFNVSGTAKLEGVVAQSPNEASSYGIYLWKGGTLNSGPDATLVSGAAIYCEDIFGGNTINITGGTITASQYDTALYLPASEAINNVTITGGTISGGVGIVNLGSKLTVSGTPGPTITATSEVPVSNIGGAANKTYYPAALVDDQAGGNYQSFGDDNRTTITGGVFRTQGTNASVVFEEGGEPGTQQEYADEIVVSGGAFDNPTEFFLEQCVDDNAAITGANDVQHDHDESSTAGNHTDGTFFVGSNIGPYIDVVNETGGAAAPEGEERGPVEQLDAFRPQTNPQTGQLEPVDVGSFSGPIENDTQSSGNPNGSDVLFQGDSGVTEIRPGGTGYVNQEPPAPPAPGSPTVVQNAVLQAKDAVVANAAGYAKVSVGSTLLDWTVDVTSESATVGDVATDILAPIVSALSGSGAVSATSVQNAQVTIAFPATAEAQAAFCQSVLDNAEATTMAAGSPIATLVGKVCGIRVACTNGSTLTYTFAFTAANPTPGPAPEGTVAVYRLYNRWAGTHLYTTDTTEVARCVADGWTNEHVYWYAPARLEGGDFVVLRFYNPYSGDHYYCPETDQRQVARLERDGWVRESSASWIRSAPVDSQFPIYTLWNPYRMVDTHLYTPYLSEAQENVALGWEWNETAIWAAALP